MNRLGIQSLNAGAPDLRLTGDQQMASAPDPTAEMNDFSMQVFGKPLHQLTPPQLESLYELMNEQSKAPAPKGTYTQNRKTNMMAYGGIAGLEKRQGYFLGKLVDKIKDDLIPNEIKENPLLTAAILGSSTKIPGLPTTGWLGDLLGKAEGVPYLGPIATGMQNVGTGITNLANMIPGVNLPGGTEYSTTRPRGMDVGYSDAEKQAQILAQGPYLFSGAAGGARLPDTARTGIETVINNELKKKGFMDYANQAKDFLLGDTTRGDQTFNWKIPVAAGLAAGAYTAGQPRDTLPIDTTGINFQTAQEAMDDPNLRFKPKLEDTQLAAEGGRIGYQGGGFTDPKNMTTEMLIAVVKDGRSTPEILMELEKRIPGAIEQIKLEEGQGDQAFSIKQHILDQYDPDKRAVEEDFLYDLRENIDSNYREPRKHRPIAEPFMAQGGRIGFDAGGNYEAKIKELMDQGLSRELAEVIVMSGLSSDRYDIDKKAQGGRIGLKKGSKKKRSLMDFLYDEEGFNLPGFMIPASMAASSILPFLKEGGRVPAQEGGLMDLGGMEKDYRQEGGFVPIGGKEKADDVPARLSKNEFVFTADAVRSAGDGDIDEGAAVMERLMENLEAGGKVSEDSQGLEGARSMFANAQQLQKRII